MPRQAEVAEVGPRMEARAAVWRALWATASASAVALAVGGCGGAGRSHAGAAAATSATGDRGAQVATGGCREVPRPAPRRGAHEPSPQLRLSPAHTYTVKLETNCGEIRIALAAKSAPRTAASFAWLVKRGFYNGLTFHRIVPNFVIQGGDPLGNGTGGPGYSVVEAPPAGTSYTRGVVAMAKTQSEPAGTSGSQFFIVTAANAGLPPEYALVGHVVGSDAAIEAIARTPRVSGPEGEESTPARAIVIEHATLASGQ
ncbi:MAG TPA: peptidylprolyl isomerase [Solirubrobacteraceae bacterium]|nr:peptidylprolyl isomerase [Solirubrobacteraceae bacterium]